LKQDRRQLGVVLVRVFLQDGYEFSLPACKMTVEDVLELFPAFQGDGIAQGAGLSLERVEVVCISTLIWRKPSFFLWRQTLLPSE
jgi:hypothetical protein